MEKGLRIANLLLLLVNVGLFGLWFSLIRKDALPPGGEQATYILNQVSVQVTALGTMVAFGALFLAGLGVFGFQAVMERAASQAEAVAQKLVAQKWDDFLRQSGPLIVPRARGPLPEASDAKEAQEGS